MGSRAEDNWLEEIEPEALGLSNSGSNQMAAQASIAVSLKRIADILENLHIDQGQLSLIVQGIAWNAGRSFQHGMRTDK